MNDRKRLIARVEALEARLKVDVEVDLLQPIRARAYGTALTLEELQEIMQKAEEQGQGHVMLLPEQQERFAAALEKISMDLTGQPFDRIPSLPWATLHRAKRMLTQRWALSQDVRH